jgi:hypothetical protein
VLLSHQRKRRKKGGGESGDSFMNVYLRLGLTCLLLSAICCCRLCLLRILLDACCFCFLQYAVLPAFCNFHLFFIYSLRGECPPLHSCGVFHRTATVTSLPLSKHTGGGAATPAFLGQLVYLQFAWRSAPPPLSWAGAPRPLWYVSFFFQLLV